MSVYTYFDGMPGLLGAVRQEGFSRLASRLSVLVPTDDPVGDLAAAGAAYASSARDNPDLYALMFDGALPLPDRGAADATLGHLVAAVSRAKDAGRFTPEVEPVVFANELWMFGHGACMLFVTGVLEFAAVEPIMTSGLARFYQAAGDHPDTARKSVRKGWSRGLTTPTD